MIFGITGEIGSGKSYTQLMQALEYCEKRHKQLVVNFPINLRELYKYATMPKHSDNIISLRLFEIRFLFAYILRSLRISPKYAPYPNLRMRMPWVAWMCKNGGIIQIPNPKNLESLLVPESVVCLDEAGIFLNSREFAKTSKQLLSDLAQSRKDGVDLFYAAQFDEQVDKQLRLLTQYWIHCDSLSTYDKVMKRPKLVWKTIHWFKANSYWNWQSNVRDKDNPWKTRFAYAFRTISGFLSPSDVQLFKVFDSFNRLDSSQSLSKIHTLYKCNLPDDYYLGKDSNSGIHIYNKKTRQWDYKISSF